MTAKEVIERNGGRLRCVNTLIYVDGAGIHKRWNGQSSGSWSSELNETECNALVSATESLVRAEYEELTCFQCDEDGNVHHPRTGDPYLVESWPVTRCDICGGSHKLYRRKRG